MKFKKMLLSLITFVLIFTINSPVLAAYGESYCSEYFLKTSDGKFYNISNVVSCPYVFYTEQIKPAETELVSDRLDAEGQYIDLFTKKMKFTSSNKNVATIVEKYDKSFKKYYYIAKLNKTGKTTIKTNNKVIRTIHVASYQNPCKSFKIGSTEYVSKFKKHPVACIGLKKGQEKKGKIHVQAANGWKLKHIGMITVKGDLNPRKIKNGQAIKLKGYNKIDQTYNMDNWLVFATFQNSKTKQYSDVVLYSGKEEYVANMYIWQTIWLS